MSKMTLTPELTEALCVFCFSVDCVETRVDLINCIEDHYLEEETDEPAEVLDTLKALRSMKRDMIDILEAMKKAENHERNE